MTPKIYNISMLSGVLMVGIGVALVNIPTALVVTGTIVIAITAFSANLASKR